MTANLREYDAERDFIRIRDFLLDTYGQFEAPVNWGIERWNYARYFVAPFLGAYGKEEPTEGASLQAIRFWEEHLAVWEGAAGEIVGVACIETPDPEDTGFGEVFVQRHPEHLDLLDEMLAYCEKRFRDPKKNRVYIWVYDDDAQLLEAVSRRGYEQSSEPTSRHLEYVMGELPGASLPEGFRFLSMADENDIEKRREIFGRGFNHEDPKEWPSAFSYRELQKAPDYRTENDLVIVSPDGTYAACCIVWYDAISRVAHLEPLGTHPDYRRRGLTRELVFEGLRRMKALGATRAPMTGGFEPFYEAIGFEARRVQHAWIKTFQTAA
ncbi:MAG: GNAT family N-acetyltransferase [Candidatus Bipolaricaulia bacterium]